MLKGIKLVVFDLDGTLVDAYPAIIKSFNYTMQQFGLPDQSAFKIRRAVGFGDRNLLKPFVQSKDLSKALIVYRRHHRHSLVKWAHLLPGAHKVLDRLYRQGYKLAVATNRPTRFSGIIVRHLKIRKYFDFMLCGDKLKNMKPDPEVLHRIMHRLGVLPRQTVFVGDMTIDAQTAQNARVKSVVVLGGSSSIVEIKSQRPYRMIKKISHLIRLFPKDK